MTRSYLSRPVVVAVPVNNEVERIGDCLRALALQDDSDGHQIYLLLNNCVDGTAQLVAELIPRLPVRVDAVEVTLPPAQANAGCARRLAMENAASLAGPDGIVMTTDADGRVYPDWISANLRHIDFGADAVAGRAEIDPLDAALIPAHLHEADAEECRYAAALDEIDALLDPDPADPWPRHDEHSGASLAASVSVYRRAGGLPEMPLGEDRAFGAVLRRIDARIRHAPDVKVVVSGRTNGRARGGMADTISRRLIQLDNDLDSRLEPVKDAVRRASLRHQLRRLWRAGLSDETIAGAAARLDISGVFLSAVISERYFGVVWAEIEAKSPILVRRSVLAADAGKQLRQANLVLTELRRKLVTGCASTDPIDIPAHDTAVTA